MQESDKKYLDLDNTRLAYRVYEFPESESERDLVLLHGAGVGGELTWEAMLPHLSRWRRILVPDLKGMGDSRDHSGEEVPVHLKDLATEVFLLIEHLQWRHFDLIGYSLGGLVALWFNMLRVEGSRQTPCKLVLLEPASLDRECMEELRILRENYRTAASVIRETGDVELGIAQFVDTVAPNRRKHPVAEATTQSRLAHRPIGFSYALDAVTDAVHAQVESPQLRERLLACSPSTLLMAGGLSHNDLKSHYQMLAKRLPGWQSIEISGTDHSLPFQKPRQIASFIVDWYQNETYESRS